MISKRKQFLFTVVTILLPIVALIVLEIGLFLAGVGVEKNTAFIEIEDGSEFVAFNPRFAGRYFSDFVPSVAFNPVLRDKPADTIRIVTLGGSSTAGFPYQFYYGFPESLERRLSASSRDQRVEVVNLGMTAVNSYTIWDLRSHVVDLNPDLVVIYAGHNEFYGAFGAGSTINTFGNSRFLKRLILHLKMSALYSGLESLFNRSPNEPGGGNSSGPDRTLMARVVGEADIPFQGKVYDMGLAQFESNMEDVLNTFARHDIPVFIGTLVSNLSGQEPLGSTPEAQALFNQARESSCEERGCNLDLFQQAKDMDNIRFRAPSELNEVIRTFATRDGVHLVDVFDAFAKESLSGVPGYDLFIDHLHPTQEAYDMMGKLFADAIMSELDMNAPSDGWPVDTALDPLETAHASLQIERLLADYPFFKDRSISEVADISDQLIDKYRSRSAMDSLATTLVAPPRPFSAGLIDALNLTKSEPISQIELRLYEALFHWQPFNVELMQSVIAQSIQNEQMDSLTVRLAELGARHTNDVYFWNGLGAVFLRMNHLQSADLALKRAERVDSASAPMLFNRARYYVAIGDTLLAQDYFKRYQAGISTPEN